MKKIVTVSAWCNLINIPLNMSLKLQLDFLGSFVQKVLGLCLGGER